MTNKNIEHFSGCLLGGAVGDALGAPVEFKKLSTIKHTYGSNGIQNFAKAYGKIGAITDDTQMTLFTAEGLLRAEAQNRINNNFSPVKEIYEAYKRWYYTQTIGKDYGLHKGLLIGKEELFASRAPGNTCLSSLRSNRMGTIFNYINSSKGCGTVMRTAPIGLFFSNENDSFILGAKAASITHGHPNAFLSSGFIGSLITNIINNISLKESIDNALHLLKISDNSEQCVSIIKDAISLSERKSAPEISIKMLGEGWVAEEAVAISVFCALKFQDDFNKGIQAAVNHDGDSDSTGAITGNILGALLGKSAIDKKYLDKIEMRDTIEQIAMDLLTRFEDTDEWKLKYPTS